MSWKSARNSSSLLAERLKKFERSPSSGDRRSSNDEAPRAAPAAQPVYVKPPRKVQPPPQQIVDAISAEWADADLIEAPVFRDQPSAPQVVAEDEAAEGRLAPRKNQALPAYITAPGMSNIIPARVIDMSATGAKIELTPMGRSTGIPLGYLPERFVLVLRHDRMEVDCETVWQDEWLMGLRFLGFPRPTKEKC